MFSGGVLLSGKDRKLKIEKKGTKDGGGREKKMKGVRKRDLYNLASFTSRISENNLNKA